MHRPYRQGRRWLGWFLLYCAAVAVVFVIGLVIEAAVGPGRKGGPSPAPFRGPAVAPSVRAPGPPQGTVRGPAGGHGTPGAVSLAGPVAVAAGREVINGVELGFPHSTAGAVSAAADAAGEVFSTLDPDRAAAVMRLVAGPSFPGGPQEAARGAVTDRRSLGLPAAGPVPAGYSLVVQPVEYQARNVTPDSVLVLLLCDFTTSRPGAGTRTRVGVFPFGMGWARGDWKVTSPGTASYVSLAAEPFSPGAAALGWQELLPAGGGTGAGAR